MALPADRRPRVAQYMAQLARDGTFSVAPEDLLATQETLAAVSVPQPRVLEVLRQTYEQFGYLLCPHSAVGYAVAQREHHRSSQPVVHVSGSPEEHCADLEGRLCLQRHIRPSLRRP
jgi:threonine synthase